MAGLDALYAQDSLAALTVLGASPPEPVKQKSNWWSLVPRAAAGAAANMLGGMADVAKGYGAAAAITLESDPLARVAVGERAAREGAAEGRRQIASGEALLSEGGELARGVAQSYRPDPLTASKAEQTVYDVLSGLGRAVAHATLFGPAAPVTFGVDTALQTNAELADKGVDQGTRLAAAGLTGAANAAGFLVPVAGKTWASTLALGALSGPASFVAQQAATGEILRRANYAEIAKQFDPLDPWGLAASLLPFGFGALAMRGRSVAGGNVAPRPEIAPLAGEREAGAPTVAEAPAAVPEAGITHEAVDAAMVHNLTALADAHEAQAADTLKALTHDGRIVQADGQPLAINPDHVAFQKAIAKGDELAALEVLARIRQGEGRTVTDSDRFVVGVRVKAQAAEPIMRAEPSETPAPTIAPEAHAEQVAQRVAQVEAERPDLPVRTAEDGHTVTAADEMARVREEAAQGTDAELGSLDADLLRVAADCALSLG